MNKIVLAAALTLLSLSCMGQRWLVFGDMESTQLHRMNPCVIENSVVIDTTMLTVEYRYESTNNRLPIYATIQLQIGRKWIKQTDMRTFYSAIHNNAVYRQDKKVNLDSLRTSSEHSGNQSNLFLEMSYNRDDDQLQVVSGDYFTINRPNIYREKRPQIAWVLLHADSTICGYNCQGARAQFRGREWMVWFTPSIPLEAGPWKLSGLPGLILLAQTDGFKFECTNLKQTESSICSNSYKNTHEFKTRKLYMQYERNSFIHPYETFAAGGEAIVLTKDKAGKSVALDNSWTIPYNPIELE